ncbi:MAG: hypothetical protein ACNS62_04815 [Candidatus Cyclobacteriaceae bacterium M3_2C_046]
MIKIRHYIIIILIFSANISLSQVKMPVQVNTNLSFPVPVYLSDFSSSVNQSLSCQLIFTDYNEPSWDVKISITISSSNIKLKTRKNFIPQSPINLSPGMAHSLTGSDFYEYLLPENLNINGSGASAFLQTGRLPEGFYNFCIQVLDYHAGVPLSLVSCGSGWVQLKDPPNLIQPACQSFIQPDPSQNINFQWQPVNLSLTENIDLQYILRLHEVTDFLEDPKYALVNGQARQIFESAFLFSPSYSYSLADPVLETGKQYIFEVQAVDLNGKDVFKNQGISEPCVFYYGYPENANIQLLGPENRHSFAQRDHKLFKWTAPDKKITNQPFIYELSIVALNEGQDSSEAMVHNPSFYSHKSAHIYSQGNFTKKIAAQDTIFTPGQLYAWQVKAHSGNQEVATSSVGVFRGPALIEYFYVNDIPVKVTRIKSGNLKDLSGEALVLYKQKELPAKFSHIRIKETKTSNLLESGELIIDAGQLDPIALAPELEENDSAYFEGAQIILNNQGLRVWGNIKWPFPHPTLDQQKAQVVSRSAWFEYEDFKITGSCTVQEKDFDLLDPFGFTMKIDTTSRFFVLDNQYKVKFDGEVKLKDMANFGHQFLEFDNAINLLYLESQHIINQLELAAISNTGLLIKSNKATIDLSESKSPSHPFMKNNWKGIFLDQYQVSMLPDIDKHQQIELDSIYLHLVQNPSEQAYAWIDGQGLNCQIDHQINLNGISNSFDCDFTNLKVHINQGVLMEGYLKGKLMVPFLDQKSSQSFTIPLSYNGFTPGYLDLIDYALVLNQDDPYQQVTLNIRKAEFQGNDHLATVLDLHWPALDIKLSNLAQFKIWANQEIGFGLPNGSMTLQQQANGRINQYPITVDQIGAGRDQNFYAFGAAFQINLSEDISGLKGPPISAIYAVQANDWLDTLYQASNPTFSAGSWTPQTKTKSSSKKYTPREFTQDLEQKINRQTFAFRQQQLEQVGIADNLIDKEVPVETDRPLIESGDSLKTADLNNPKKGFYEKLSSKQAQLVDGIIEGFAEELASPITITIDSTAKAVTHKIDSLIKVQTTQGLQFIGRKVDTLMIRLSMSAADAIDLGEIDDQQILDEITQSTSLALNQNLGNSLKSSIRQNISGPLTTEIGHTIPELINQAIRTKIAKGIIACLEGKMNKNYLQQEILKELTLLGKNTTKRFLQDYLHPGAIKQRISNTAKMAVNDLNPQKILDDMLRDFSTKMIQPENIARLLEDVGMEKLSQSVVKEGSLSNNLVQTGLVFTSLKSKDTKGKLALAASNIKIKNAWLEMTGQTTFEADHPIYGDCWKADVNLLIKKPKNIPLKGHYINGKTNQGDDFWFAQVAADDTQYPGGAINKSPKALNQPVNLGYVDMVAASARVYKHMRESAGQSIVPDPSVKQGGYFRFICFDHSNQGKMIRFNLEGELITSATENDTQLDLAGDLQVLSPTPKVLQPDPRAMANLAILIQYNSAEDHFLGEATVDIASPALCATGYFAVETLPDYWQVKVGTYDDKLKVTPGCNGWGGMGYLLMDNQKLEAALGVALDFNAGVDMKLGLVDLGIVAQGHAAAGVLAGLKYHPEVGLLKAGLWLELYANVRLNYVINYLFGKEQGSLTLVELYVLADLLVNFDPPPTWVEGNIKGKIDVLNGLIKCRFKAGFKKTL